MFNSLTSWAKGLINKISRKSVLVRLTAEQATEIINDLNDSRATWELAEEHLGKRYSFKVYRKMDQEVVLVRQGEDYLITEVRVTKGESSWCPDEWSDAIAAELDEIWFYGLRVRLAACLAAADEAEMEEYA